MARLPIMGGILPCGVNLPVDPLWHTGLRERRRWPVTLQPTARGGSVKKYGPATDESRRYAGRPTFLRLPHTTSPEDVDIAVLGVPFDAKPSWRTGARFGPGAIRQGSLAIRPLYNPSQRIAPFDHVSVVERGDTQVESGFMDRTFEHVQQVVGELIQHEVVPVCLGGDHVVTLAALRAASERHGQVALLAFDAHVCAGEEVAGERYDHGTLVRRAVDERLIDPACSFLFGSRGGTWDRRR